MSKEEIMGAVMRGMAAALGEVDETYSKTDDAHAEAASWCGTTMAHIAEEIEKKFANSEKKGS